MPFNANLFLLAVVVLLIPVETYAFGAGDIPDFAYLNDKAFRHGDIENILETLVKSAGGLATGGNLLDFAQSVISHAAGGAKFSKSDVKRVYFGNWLRDFSQAMDIAGLSKLTGDTLILIVSILGFMTFGFATEEFQVTADRLGVYLPVEHIDNPRGYAAKEGDARQFHPKLRPPVDDRELEIDERTGMKNYMATENQGWDTSTAFIRRTFRACIEAGRRAGGRDGPELYEAYRLLGTGLHTMEDLLAHSNWCEVALRKMGYQAVFCHVGDDVIINTPNGPAPPLVTGTFGGADFIHSLIGEATDKLSQTSVTDLSQKMSNASQGNNNISIIKNILSKLPIGGENEDRMNQGEQMHAQSQAYNFNPDNIAPPEVQQQLFELLKWRDSIYRDVIKSIEMVPGLADLLDELSNALNAYVYTVISPYVTPILEQATSALGEGSKAVIDTEDQYDVFENPRASDPTHSFLSKDHFNLILNEPAGKIAQIVVEHSVNLIVQAWGNDNDSDQVIDQILEAFHHPYYAAGNSEIQHRMFEHMEKWIGALGPEEAELTLQLLTKESVRNGKNKRPGSDDSEAQHGELGHIQPSRPQYGSNDRYGQQGQYGSSRTDGPSGRTYGGQYDSGHQTYGGRDGGGSRYESGRNDYSNDGHGGRDSDRRTEHDSSHNSRDDYNQRYSGRENDDYRRGDEGHQRGDGSYGNEGYGRSNDSSGRGDQEYRRNDDSRYSEYGGSRYNTQEDYGSRRQYREDNQQYGGERTSYGSGRYGGEEQTYREETRQEYSSYVDNERRGYDPSSGLDNRDREYSRDNSYSGHGGEGARGEYGSSYDAMGGQGSYGSSGRNDQYTSSGYNRGGEYSGRNEYGSSDYGSRYEGGNSETFGAERLNIRDEDGYGSRRHHGRRDDDDDRREHHGHRHRKSQDSD